MTDLKQSSDGHYRTIVADPPWQTKTGPSWGRNDKSAPINSASHDLEYPTMTVEAIAALDVASLAAADAHLYLWTTNGYVEAAYEIARAAEFVIFARRGSLPAQQRVDSSWWLWPRSRHSAKPEAFLDIVEQVSPGPYLEIFARRARFGWEYAGDGSLGTVQIPGLRAPEDIAA